MKSLIKNVASKSVKSKKTQKKNVHKKSGFTLMEILVVIAIMGMLATGIMSAIDLTTIDDAENSTAEYLAAMLQNVTKHMESNSDYVKLNAFSNTLTPICNTGVTGAAATTAGCIDLWSHVVPVYMAQLPVVEGYQSAATNGLFGCTINGSVAITSDPNFTGCGDHGGGGGSTMLADASSSIITTSSSSIPPSSSSSISTTSSSSIPPSSSSSVSTSSSSSGDVSPPLLIATTPTDNAVGVAVTTNIVLTFNEAVNAGAGSVSVYRTSDNGLVGTFLASSASGLGTSTVTFNPSWYLGSSTSYYVLVAATAFTDTSGNAFAGISSTTALNFTTTGSCDSICVEGGSQHCYRGGTCYMDGCPATPPSSPPEMCICAVCAILP
jgi:prepilin-type N-terminal cleavage/methylation domain-containing protein